MGFRDLVHRFGNKQGQADTNQAEAYGSGEYDEQTDPNAEYEQTGQYGDEEYVAEGEEADVEEEEAGNGAETYNYNQQLEEGDEAVEQEGDGQDPYDEVGDDVAAAAEITSIHAEDEEADEDQTLAEQTKAMYANAYDAHSEGLPSDDETEGKSHDYAVTIRSVLPSGDSYELKGKADTGADANCLSDLAVQTFNLETIPEEPGFEKTFKTGNGEMVQSAGVVILKFSFDKEDRIHKERFHVVPGMSNDVLLGTPFLRASGAIKMKGKFKETDEEKAETEALHADSEGDIDVMASQPPTKAEKAADDAHAVAVQQKNVGKRTRPAPS